MLSQRQRFLQTLNFQPADPPFVRPSGCWQETAELWLQQGWDGRPFHEIFNMDHTEEVSVYYGPMPMFEFQVVEENETTRLYINHEGILMREFKEHRDTSMPQFVKFPVENEADFEQLSAERLGLNREVRFTPEWQQRVEGLRDSGLARICWANRWGGFFGPLRNLMGLQGLCMAFYDQPALVERMMEQRADSIIQTTEVVMQHTEFEAFWFWEDMAYNSGPLINPALFRKFALKHYRRVCDWLRSRGVQHIWLDSDGDIHKLIPIWLEAGINGLWPFEVNAGMDVLEIRKQYGHSLAIGGGIPKTTLIHGGETMRRAVDRVMPLVEDGGYLPELDHSAPPDISWKNFCEYNEYLLHRLGRG